MNLKKSKWKFFDEFAVIFISICFFALFLMGKRGILVDFALIGLVLAGIYSLFNIEIFLAFTIYAAAIKATYLNILPGAIDMTLLFMFLLFAAIFVHVVFNLKKLPMFYLFDVVIVFMLISVFISFLNTPSDEFSYGLEKLLRFIFLSVPFFFIPRIFEDTDLKKIIRFFAFFGGLFSIGIFIYYPDFIALIHSGINYLPIAKMAGISLIFNVYLLIEEKGFFKKALFAILTLFSLLMLFKANSRGGILFAFLVLMLYAWYVLRDKKVYLLVFVLMVFLSVFVVLSVSPDSFRRFMLLFGRHKGASASIRLLLYSLALQLFSKYWFTGVGLGGFAKYHYLKYPHNLFLEFAVEQGLAGLIVVSIFLFYLFYCSWVLIKRFKLNGEYTPFILSFLFVALYHMTSFSLIDLRWLFFFAGFVFVFYKRTVFPVEESEKKEQLKI